MIEIIADSICDLPPSLMSHYQLKVLPLHVYLNEQEYRDKVDISTEAVYAAMRQDILPKTSQISLEDTLNQFSACAQNSQDFIYPAFSAALSGSCGNNISRNITTYSTAVHTLPNHFAPSSIFPFRSIMIPIIPINPSFTTNSTIRAII